MNLVLQILRVGHKGLEVVLKRESPSNDETELEAHVPDFGSRRAVPFISPSDRSIATCYGTFLLPVPTHTLF